MNGKYAFTDLVTCNIESLIFIPLIPEQKTYFLDLNLKISRL